MEIQYGEPNILDPIWKSNMDIQYGNTVWKSNMGNPIWKSNVKIQYGESNMEI